MQVCMNSIYTNSSFRMKSSHILFFMMHSALVWSNFTHVSLPPAKMLHSNFQKLVNRGSRLTDLLHAAPDPEASVHSRLSNHQNLHPPSGGYVSQNCSLTSHLHVEGRSFVSPHRLSGVSGSWYNPASQFSSQSISCSSEPEALFEVALTSTAS